MYLSALLLLSSLATPQLSAPDSLLAAVPEDAFTLAYVKDPSALRSRAERNDWVSLYTSSAGEPALRALEHEFESITGSDFDGLLGLALGLHGESLLFLNFELAGLLTQPPEDRTALCAVMRGWLPDGPRRELDVAGAKVQLGVMGGLEGRAAGLNGYSMAFLDHPSALGLFAGKNSDAVLAALTESLLGLASARRSGVVQQFLSAGGGSTRGIEYFIDYAPFIAQAEKALRQAGEGLLPDPSGFLGLERGTWFFASADFAPGSRIDAHAHLQIPPDTLAAKLADAFEVLPRSLPTELPLGTWSLSALDWNVSRFYGTVRAAYESSEAAALAMLDQGLATAEMFSGVDPIEDVIQQLSGWFALYHVLDQGGWAAGAEGGFALLAGMRDTARFMDAFEAAFRAAGMEIEPSEFEGASTYLFGPDGFLSQDSGEPQLKASEAGAPLSAATAPSDKPGEYDGGLSVLPHALLASLSRNTLARGLRAMVRKPNAGLPEGSDIQAAFDENASASAFAYIELAYLREFALLSEGQPSPTKKDPFDTSLIFSAVRSASGFDLRAYTR